MNEPHRSSLVLEDIPSIVGCHTVGSSSQSADLAPVHGVIRIKSQNSPVTSETVLSSRVLYKLDGSMEKKMVGDSSAHSSGLASELREKLTLKNGIMNGMKIGTTDVEVHVPGFSSVPPKPPKGPPPLDESLSESSHESASKSDVNGTVCNGHTVSEATSSNSIAISETSFSTYSEKESSDSSHSFSGARPRTRNTSNSSSQGTQPKSEVDLSSTSESLKTPEISISPVPSTSVEDDTIKVEYVNYENELQMSSIMKLIQKDLSEPYSIYTYRYFIHNWPKLCFLAMCYGEVVGAIVCKLDVHKKVTVRGYIAMLAVDHRFRKKKIGVNLSSTHLEARTRTSQDTISWVLATAASATAT
ncbi:unnamed protein product, partial [Meganyctiphanes norvegica]